MKGNFVMLAKQRIHKDAALIESLQGDGDIDLNSDETEFDRNGGFRSCYTYLAYSSWSWGSTPTYRTFCVNTPCGSVSFC